MRSRGLCQENLRNLRLAETRETQNLHLRAGEVVASLENLRKLYPCSMWKPRPRLLGEMTHTWLRAWKSLLEAG